MALRAAAAAKTPPDREAPILLGPDAGRGLGGTRWTLLLVIFMRIVAVIWMAQGLLEWAAILGPGASAFELGDWVDSTAIGFFAVVDLLAAVGLWLAAPWGAVLWILAVATQVVVAVLLPDFYPLRLVLLAADFVMVLIYFLLTWSAARESEA